MNPSEERRAMRIPVKRIENFRSNLLDWYNQFGRVFPWRDSSRTPYEICMAEILLQRTKAEAVSRYYEGFIEAFPSWSRLAATDDQTLQCHLEPLGLWRRKSHALLSLARYIVSSRMALVDDREALESLPGVGQYIANAILLICFGKAEPLLDVNMARLLERYFGKKTRADLRYDHYLQALARNVVNSPKAVALNWSILDFSSLVCKARNPRCKTCPIRNDCEYYMSIR